MRQFAQQILPAGLPADDRVGLRRRSRRRATAGCSSTTPPRSRSRPGGTGRSGSSGSTSSSTRTANFLPHLLPVDPTLHWANPPGGDEGRDMRPTFTETPGPYTGRCRSSRTCTAPSAWATTATATRRPGTCLPRTTSRRAMRRRAPGTSSSPARPPAAYGVDVGARLRDVPVPEREPRLDDLVPRSHARDDAAQRLRGPGRLLPRSAAGRPATTRCSTRGPAARRRFPGPAPRENDKFPPNKPYHEIPIAIQDRSFNADGSLFYPDTRAFFDEIVGRPTSPEGEFSPIWNPEFFGNTIMVNGNTWPFLDGRAAPLPLPLPERLPVALPHPRLQRTSPASRCGRSATRAGSSPPRSTSPPTTATGC